VVNRDSLLENSNRASTGLQTRETARIVNAESSVLRDKTGGFLANLKYFCFSNFSIIFSEYYIIS